MSNLFFLVLWKTLESIYITSTTSSKLDELPYVKHEEADARIFAHLCKSPQSFRSRSWCDTVSYSSKGRRLPKLEWKWLKGWNTFQSMDKMKRWKSGKWDVRVKSNLLKHMYATCKSDLWILPPTDNAFHQHLLRALYQLALYKNSHNSYFKLQPPTEWESCYWSRYHR